MSYSGRCQCGSVSLKMAGEPVATRQCWCRQCQQISCGGPTQNAMFLADNVSVSGAMSEHGYTAQSGNSVTQFFCPSCGMHIMATTSFRPQYRTIRFGVINEPHGLKPQMAIWTSEAPDWAIIDVELEQLAAQPLPPSQD